MSTPVSHAAPAAASRSIALPFAAIVLAMLPAVLDQTILATALPTIAGDLGRLTDVSWVVTAYVVAAAATTRCGASSATATAASGCSRSRWSCSSPPPRSAAPPRASPS